MTVRSSPTSSAAARRRAAPAAGRHDLTLDHISRSPSLPLTSPRPCCWPDRELSSLTCSPAGVECHLCRAGQRDSARAAVDKTHALLNSSMTASPSHPESAGGPARRHSSRRPGRRPFEEDVKLARQTSSPRRRARDQRAYLGLRARRDGSRRTRPSRTTVEQAPPSPPPPLPCSPWTASPPTRPSAF